jgi:hypothetical protein
MNAIRIAAACVLADVTDQQACSRADARLRRARHLSSRRFVAGATPRRASRAAPLLAAGLLMACTDLGDIERDECGNGVIEPQAGEDCDGAENCGAPDTEQACRILCALEAEGACPGNAACGVDGVCHAPGGNFEAAASVPWTTPHLLVADTSGDGYPELVGVGTQHVDVRVGARDLSLSPLPAIPSPALSGTPRTVDFEDDSDADIAIPVGAGVFSLAGSSATVLDPFFYNSFPAPGDGRIVANGIEFADIISLPVIAVHDAMSNMSVLLVPGDTEVAALFPPGRTVNELVGDNLPIGQIVDNSLTARTIALVFATGRAIALYDIAIAPSLTITARAPVMLPLNTDVKNGAWFADFDGDAHLDLVVSVKVNGVEGIAVAWGNGSGALADNLGVANAANIVWRADRDQDGQAGVDGPLDPVMVGQVTDNPVILGDENDADVIAAGGLYTTACVLRSQCGLHLLRASTRTWSGAAIADFNHDDFRDVAAFQLGQTGVELLLQTSTTILFNDALVPTANAVERVMTGDFNGDTIDDLVYVESVLGVAYTDSLSVAYGRNLGTPEPPVFVGSVGEMIAGGALLANGVGGSFDLIKDIVLVTDRQIDGTTRRGAAFLFGSTTKRLFAPLISDPIDLPNRQVQSSTVQDVFTMNANTDSFADLVVLTSTVYGPSSTTPDSTPLAVPHARVYAGSSDGQVMEVDSLDLSLVPLNLGDAHWLGADVVGSATDEAVGLTSDGGLILVNVDNCTGVACIMPIGGPPGVTDPVAFHAVDIENDGDLDLVALMRNRSTGTGTRDASVVVWWNENGFAATRTQVLNGNYADAALVDLERDGTRELIVLERGAGDDGGRLAAAHLASGAFGAFEPVAPTFDGVALQAADLNGDALEDLVVVTGVDRNAPRELTVYTQSESRISSGEE